MPDKPKEKPSLDDIVRDFGYDKMAFFCDMVRPDQHVEREDEGLPAQSDRAPEVTLDPEHERARPRSASRPHRYTGGKMASLGAGKAALSLLCLFYRDPALPALVPGAA